MTIQSFTRAVARPRRAPRVVRRGRHVLVRSVTVYQPATAGRRVRQRHSGVRRRAELPQSVCAITSLTVRVVVVAEHALRPRIRELRAARRAERAAVPVGDISVTSR